MRRIALMTFPLVTPAPAGAGTRYELVHLTDTIGTGVSMVGTDMNNAGMVSGIATSSFLNDLAFKPWIADFHTGKVVDLSPSAGADEYLYAGPISDNGQVAGFFITPLSPGDRRTTDRDNALVGLPVPFGTAGQAVF